MHAFEHKFPPPLLALLIAAAMAAFARIASPLEVSDTLRLALSGVLLLAGGAISVLGIAAFRRAKTTINPVTIDAASQVVTTGVFGYTRNPMYVGLTTLLLSWAAYLAVPLGLVGPLFFILFITRFQIVPEERVMSAKFGRAYTDYQARVRRWV